MKILISILLFLKIEILLAGSPLPPFIASPKMPNINTGYSSPVIEQQNFFLWEYRAGGCFDQFTDSYIEYLENEINVFDYLTGSVCPTPPPPPHYRNVIEIQGLEEGNYDINYHIVRPPDLFPPNTDDYPNYLIGSTRFSVLKIISVNSSSYLSLIILILLMLSIGFKKYSKINYR